MTNEQYAGQKRPRSETPVPQTPTKRVALANNTPPSLLLTPEQRSKRLQDIMAGLESASSTPTRRGQAKAVEAAGRSEAPIDRGPYYPPDPHALFVERWASARAGNGPIARLATARNCLQVQLTATELVVTPHFPFTLGFMPELYDYDKRIALDSVMHASHLGGRRSRVVEIAYLKRDGSHAVLLLRLSGGDRFVDLVRSASAAAPPPVGAISAAPSPIST